MIPRSVLRQYSIGTIRLIRPIAIGLIHQTFEIESSTGDYIMQKLHPKLSSEKIAKDFVAVTEHLHAQHVVTPHCLLTRSGHALARNGQYVWRAQTKLEGRTFQHIQNAWVARQAGEMLGRFHKAMQYCPHIFKSPLQLHQTEKIFAKFLSVTKKFQQDPLMKSVETDVDFIKASFPRFFLPADLPQHVIHGDPKISNFLFQGKKAHALIDLDTCHRNSLLVELGDAFRSWCGKEEDDHQNTFSLPIFRAAWKGYVCEAKHLLSQREISLIPKAISTITLELASRFLTDYFEDQYFGWNPDLYLSRRTHNLARARGQLALFGSVQKRQEKLCEMISLTAQR